MVLELKERPVADIDGALPPSVEAAISGLSVIPRGQDSEGRERMMLHWSGGAVVAWYHSPDETRRRLAVAWPFLDSAQLDNACRAISGKVAAFHGGAVGRRQRSAWASWSPARPSIF